MFPGDGSGSGGVGGGRGRGQSRQGYYSQAPPFTPMFSPHSTVSPEQHHAFNVITYDYNGHGLVHGHDHYYAGHANHSRHSGREMGIEMEMYASTIPEDYGVGNGFQHGLGAGTGAGAGTSAFSASSAHHYHHQQQHRHQQHYEHQHQVVDGIGEIYTSTMGEVAGIQGEYTEVQRVMDCAHDPCCSIVFDTQHELLWTGYSSVRCEAV